MLLCLLLLLPTVLALILCVDRHLVTVSPTAMSLLAAASSFAAFFSFYSHPRQSVSRVTLMIGVRGPRLEVIIVRGTHLTEVAGDVEDASGSGRGEDSVDFRLNENVLALIAL